jgi:hypothetical protein
MHPPDRSEGAAPDRAATRPNSPDANRSTHQSSDWTPAGQPTEQRCSDCIATGEEFFADAKWLSEAGEPPTNPEIVTDLLAFDMWKNVISPLHDEGAQ